MAKRATQAKSQGDTQKPVSPETKPRREGGRAALLAENQKIEMRKKANQSKSKGKRAKEKDRIQIRVGVPRKSPVKVRQERIDQYKELLKWFLNFINEPIPEYNFQATQDNIEDYFQHYRQELKKKEELCDLFGYFQFFMVGRFALVGNEMYSLDFIRESQECCRRIFKAILDLRDSMKKDLQIDLMTFSNEISRLMPSKEITQIHADFSIVIQYPDTIFKTSALRTEQKLTRKVIYKLILATVDLLSNFYLSRFKICEKDDCRKYFYQKTKKEKKYCSQSCTNRGKYQKYNEDKRKKNKSENNPNKSYLVECPRYGKQIKMTLSKCINSNKKDIRWNYPDCTKCSHLDSDGDSIIHKSKTQKEKGD